MHLTYEQWMDMMSLRYSKPLVNAKRYCDYHRSVSYTLRHAATCGGGGNRVDRHNRVQNVVQVFGQKALGATSHHVQRNPWVIERGTRDSQGNVTDGLCGDILMRGVHPLKELTVIDIRVFHPDDSSRNNEQNRKDITEQQLKKNENDKYNKYKAACDRKGYHFVPFVMTTDGALGPAAQQLVDRLSFLLSEKWRISPGITKTWMKARLAMAIARGSSACIRGCRTQRRPEEELEADFVDGAGLDRLLDMGSGVRERELQIAIAIALCVYTRVARRLRFSICFMNAFHTKTNHEVHYVCINLIN